MRLWPSDFRDDARMNLRLLGLLVKHEFILHEFRKGIGVECYKLNVCVPSDSSVEVL